MIEATRQGERSEKAKQNEDTQMQHRAKADAKKVAAETWKEWQRRQERGRETEDEQAEDEKEAAMETAKVEAAAVAESEAMNAIAAMANRSRRTAKKKARGNI